MIALQAQDFAGAKWSIALRLPGATDASIEQAIADRSIIRITTLRGTLHYVSPDDIRWMQDLISERIMKSFAGNFKRDGLDKTLFTKGRKLIAELLKDGKQLTRLEIKAAMEKKKLPVTGNCINYQLYYACLTKLICLGPRRNKEFTYTLLDEWVPRKENKLLREEALAVLAKRYFESRGPATVNDFANWAGLTIADAKQGLSSVSGTLISETYNAVTYWMSNQLPAIKPSSAIYLLPGFDEYLLSYKDRSLALDAQYAKEITGTGNGILSGTIISNGRVSGTWKRTFVKDTVEIEKKHFTPPAASKKAPFTTAVKQFGQFTGCKPIII